MSLCLVVRCHYVWWHVVIMSGGTLSLCLVARCRGVKFKLYYAGALLTMGRQHGRGTVTGVEVNVVIGDTLIY